MGESRAMRLVVNERVDRVYLAVHDLVARVGRPVTPEEVTVFLIDQQRLAEESYGKNQASARYALYGGGNPAAAWSPGSVPLWVARAVKWQLLSLTRDASNCPYVTTVPVGQHVRYRLSNSNFYKKGLAPL